jgi:hypothetical protein
MSDIEELKFEYEQRREHMSPPQQKKIDEAFEQIELLMDQIETLISEVV